MAHVLDEVGKHAELRQQALEVGKKMALAAFGAEGPGLDVDLAAIEHMAAELSQAVLAGEAGRRAFLGDGQACNWTVHRLHFRSFTPTTDFMHVVGYVYGAAGVVTNSWAAQWENG
jgi:hypothetical protein